MTALLCFCFFEVVACVVRFLWSPSQVLSFFSLASIIIFVFVFLFEKVCIPVLALLSRTYPKLMILVVALFWTRTSKYPRIYCAVFLLSIFEEIKKLKTWISQKNWCVLGAAFCICDNLYFLRTQSLYLFTILLSFVCNKIKKFVSSVLHHLFKKLKKLYPTASFWLPFLSFVT